MNQMSLVAICNEYGISRRSIQGYEKYNLVKPTGKNKYGYLLYDDKTVYRILLIKHLQNMGFTLKEIKTFINKTNRIIQEKLENKVPELEANIIKKKYLLSNSKKIIELLKQEDSEEKIYKIIKNENI